MNKFLSLKQCIKKSLPEKKKISNIIEILDNDKAALSVKRLCPHEVDIVEKSKISKESLGKKGLHLNPRGSGKSEINFITKIKNLKKNDLMLAVFKIVIPSLKEMT